MATTPDAEAAEWAADIAEALQRRNHTIAVAESLTSGSLSSSLGAADAASRWFRGGVIAYAADVKYRVLGVDEGPVITAQCADQMATGVAALTRATYGLAITGVGGPGEEEGHRPGTVFVGVHGFAGAHTQEFALDGPPAQIVAEATRCALRMFAERLREESRTV